MKSIIVDKWIFTVDTEVTSEYYKTNSLCDCAPCRNYFALVEEHYPKITEFLSQFGIDIQRPIETAWWERDKNEKTVDYIAYYAVNGTAEGSQYEIDMDTLNIVVQDSKHSPNTDIDKPYFVFGICNPVLPWGLDESYDFVFSKKEKRQFWKSLFNRK